MSALHIALTLTDNYWAPALATMRSVCLFTHRRSDLVFHLVHSGLSPQHRESLDAIVAEFGAALHYYDIAATDILSARVARLPSTMSTRLHQIVYARLFLHEIVPSEIERLIYLDCDLFVRVPIEKLYELDLGDNAMAAGLDPFRTGFQTRRDHKPKRLFDPADPYFNAGVLLIDTRKWTEIDIVGTITQTLDETEIASLYFDQDILNYVMKGRWHVLDYRWNLQEPKTVHEPMDPFIVHYTGVKKPWNLLGRIAFKRHYRHTMTNEAFYRFYRERMVHRLLRPVRLLKRRASS